MDVVAVGNAEVFIKSLSSGQELRLIAQVPLAEHTGPIASRFQHLGDRDLVRIHPLLVRREQDGKIRPIGHIDSLRIAARHQRRSGRRTKRRGHIEAGQPGALGRHLVNTRCADMRPAKATQIRIALVVREDDHEVGLRCGRGRCKKTNPPKGKQSDLLQPTFPTHNAPPFSVPPSGQDLSENEQHSGLPEFGTPPKSPSHQRLRSHDSAAAPSTCSRASSFNASLP